MTRYQYGGNNPILNIDINGDSLWVIHRTGFLGLGGKETLRYEGGNLYNKDGSAYTGKVKGFLKTTVSNLDKVGSGTEGKAMLNEIESSTSNVSVVRGNDGNKFSSGTNTVHFDPSSREGGLNTRGSRDRPTFIGLAHELAHGLDKIRGSINTTQIPGQNFTYAEHFATHMENKFRAEHFLPLREYYKYDVQTGTGICPLINSSRQSLFYNNFNYFDGVKARAIVPSISCPAVVTGKLPYQP